MANELTPQQRHPMIFVNSDGKTTELSNVTLADVFYQMMKNHGAVMETLADITKDLVLLRNDLVMTFAPDEHDPRRKEMSNRIGNLVEKRLLAEQAVRQQYGYDKGKK